MTEGLGMSAMIEKPVVVVDVQRATLGTVFGGLQCIIVLE
jgi:pyruvate/2-oxoacid:ferredoxin oxidoreductase alpha subunit